MVDASSPLQHTAQQDDNSALGADSAITLTTTIHHLPLYVVKCLLHYITGRIEPEKPQETRTCALFAKRYLQNVRKFISQSKLSGRVSTSQAIE
ncbi:hypothetical protein KIN20_008142 [Parelaphostrongylus tenuis]|uniref:Uncharacterized protein n=1 Tax=Parelaphostrongylus tenuis TaxID=148309 RepID=A0AAD5M4D1_PARTN|nr:hypothetical protein KIN20_008142 [Parelaphostrongylus tenuis]